MSGSDTDNENGGVGEDLFECRLCPNSSFTAAERDIHRQFHVDQRNQQAGRRPGPRSRVRVPAPPGTNESIFILQTRRPTPPGQQVPDSARGGRRSGRGGGSPPKKKKKEEPKSKGKKIKSKKNYKESAMSNVKHPGA